MNVPRVSVVIPALDAEAHLTEQLRSLAAQTIRGEFEVIVADNGSTDRTVEIVRSFAEEMPELRVVDAGDRRGANHARNRGAEYAEADLLAFCDADDVAEPDWLECIAAALDANHLVGGRNVVTKINTPTTVAMNGYSDRDDIERGTLFWPFVLASNLALRRSVLDELGGWSTQYIVGGDDVSLSWDWLLKGGELAFESSAVMHYRLRSSYQAIWRQHVTYGRGEALLYETYRRHGMRRRSVGRIAASWTASLGRFAVFPFAPSAFRGKAVRSLAYNVGRAKGSRTARVLYL